MSPGVQALKGTGYHLLPIMIHGFSTAVPDGNMRKLSGRMMRGRTNCPDPVKSHTEAEIVLFEGRQYAGTGPGALVSMLETLGPAQVRRYFLYTIGVQLHVL